MDALTQPIPLTLIVIAYLCVGKAFLEWAKQQVPGTKVLLWKRLVLLFGWLPWVVVVLVMEPFRKTPPKNAPDCPKADQGAGEKADDEEPTKPV